jgi:RecB family endonuclease NucS
MNETEKVSADKLQEARQILKDWLGDCGNEEPKKITTIKVVRYERNFPF